MGRLIPYLIQSARFLPAESSAPGMWATSKESNPDPVPAPTAPVDGATASTGTDL
jgi:hypothetical protein